MRRLFVRTAAAAAVLAAASTAPAAAQIPTSAFEITPLVGYIWGGGFPTAGITGIFRPASSRIAAELRLGHRSRLHAQRQHLVRADVPAPVQRRQLSSPASAPATSATCTSTLLDQLHPCRRALGVRPEPNIKPFIGGGLGVTIFDPVGAPGVGLATPTSRSRVEVGVRYMFGKGESSASASAARSAAGGPSCPTASTRRGADTTAATRSRSLVHRGAG